MILMSLLLVLSLERLITKTPVWHIERYAVAYQNWLSERKWLEEDTSSVAFYIYMLLPALIIGLVEHWLLGAFLTFIEQSIILFLCIGCPVLRATYKCFLNAADRGDLQACSMYTDQLGHCGSKRASDGTAMAEGKSFGQHLTWLNYQHYAAVMLWFIAFGAPGAVFYCFSRSATEHFCASQHPLAMAAGKLMYALDFIPVRITAFGMLMMGHFSRALPEWLKDGLSLNISAYDLLTRVSSKAEMLTTEEREAQSENAAVEPKVLVKLAKRNVIFLLVITSVLTVIGTLA
ncbi:beta-lactamase regulator AmpE [Alteromonas sp. 1_MG-2023]|uniref:beta-lactamase regulator AmpE n=1 Tax=Alteromonas sp. 1_MG-2023 TaxID=3062669 RepID=UPI0026E2467D|nr:beta-lactamase regulator AmpE [Alteromonas sp. 1_MG-2023]MDO6568298.1 beta-lactamase regulator AmpE [Alteromonas sp. 1_MG-2023]